ncbi:MAG: T9SS type A sorting domain-containing protein, partial [Cytophagia bacterium]|nr:T9SS type A sorting domain-containing protein [Cytophagia bacterium]
DQHALAFVPSNPNRMISANDGGIFVTDNNLAEEVAYTPLNKGYVTTQFYTASISRYPQEDFVIGGTQDNGSILTLNDPVGELTNSARVIGGDGGFTASTSFGIYYYMSFQNSRIYRLTLNSEAQLTSFARVDPIGGGNNPAQGYLFINPFILDPNYGNRMYLAGGDFIWRNQNLSQIPSGSQSPTSVNWKKMLDTKINEGTITALQVSTEPRNVLYYGTSNGRMYRVDNAHSDLYTVTDITSPLFSSEAYIKSIAVDPTDADHIMIAFSNYNVHSIFRSIDGGQNWSPAAGSLEGNPNGTGAGPSVRWVSIVPKTTGDYEYYAGTSVGLFSTTLIEPPTSPIWEAESPNGIGNTIVNMIDYRQSDGKIAVATHGGGIYTSQINNVVKNDNLVETNVLEVQSVYPNPFTEDVLIKINSPKTQFVFMRIYDSQGNEVKRITSSLAFQGENDFFWNGTNGQEQPVASGVYIIRITHEGGEESRRVILQRN